MSVSMVALSSGRMLTAGSFPHPPQGGLIPPNFRTTPPRLQGEMRERGEGEGGGKGKGEEKGMEGTPKGWLTPPMFQILKNTLVDGSRDFSLLYFPYRQPGL